jgi:hypothetical protein
MKGDQQIIRKLEETEKVIKELKKALSRTESDSDEAERSAPCSGPYCGGPFCASFSISLYSC